MVNASEGALRDYCKWIKKIPEKNIEENISKFKEQYVVGLNEIFEKSKSLLINTPIDQVFISFEDKDKYYEVNYRIFDKFVLLTDTLNKKILAVNELDYFRNVFWLLIGLKVLKRKFPNGVLFKTEECVYLATMQAIEESNIKEYIELETFYFDFSKGSYIYDKLLKKKVPLIHKCAVCNKYIYEDEKVYNTSNGNVCGNCFGVEDNNTLEVTDETLKAYAATIKKVSEHLLKQKISKNKIQYISELNYIFRRSKALYRNVLLKDSNLEIKDKEKYHHVNYRICKDLIFITNYQNTKIIGFYKYNICFNPKFIISKLQLRMHAFIKGKSVVLLDTGEITYLAKLKDVEKSNKNSYFEIMDYGDYSEGSFHNDKIFKNKIPVVYKCVICNKVIYTNNQVYEGPDGYLCEECKHFISKE